MPAKIKSTKSKKKSSKSKVVNLDVSIDSISSNKKNTKKSKVPTKPTVEEKKIETNFHHGIVDVSFKNEPDMFRATRYGISFYSYDLYSWEMKNLLSIEHVIEYLFDRYHKSILNGSISIRTLKNVYSYILAVLFAFGDTYEHKTITEHFIKILLKNYRDKLVDNIATPELIWDQLDEENDQYKEIMNDKFPLRVLKD